MNNWLTTNFLNLNSNTIEEFINHFNSELVRTTSTLKRLNEVNKKLFITAYYCVIQEYISNNLPDDYLFHIYIPESGLSYGESTEVYDIMLNSLILKSYSQLAYYVTNNKSINSPPTFFKSKHFIDNYELNRQGDSTNTPDGNITTFDINEEVPLNINSDNIDNPSFKSKRLYDDDRSNRNEYNSNLNYSRENKLYEDNYNDIEIIKFFKDNYIDILNFIDSKIVKKLIVEFNEIL